MSQNRRDFLVRSTCAAVGMAAFQGTLKQFGLANLLATDNVSQANCTGGYKALVCIFLNGGNDGTNMVIPYDNTYYPAYAAVRPGLAIAQPSLLPTKLTDPPSMGGRQFAFHPNMPEMTSLFNTNKLAVVTNIGTLVEPTSQADYMSGAVKKPFSLFSHSDQVQAQQTAKADTKSATGWGGRTVDAVLACNAGSSFPTMTSISGSTSFTIGLDQRPLSIGTGALTSVLVLNGFTGSPTDVARKNSMNYLRTIDNTATMIAGTSGVTQQGVDISATFGTDPTINTVFPNTGISNQLKQVAKIMKLNQTPPGLGLVRQIFFVSQGGYDTHQDQPNDQGNNFLALSQAMNAFYSATLELGLQNSVTTFTLSDFGRTLQPSGSGSSIGTDHAWASHHFVMGGAVSGGNFYGNINPATGSRFPVHQFGGLDDTTNSPNGRGRFIPATSVDEYGVTLAKWFGVVSGDIPTVFPLIDNFESAPYPGLGFV